jgi:alpha-mannosidase
MREYAHGGDLPPAHAYASLEADGGAVLSALKLAEDGDGLVVRLFEAHGRPARARLEAGGATLEAELGANRVLGFRLRPGRPAQAVDFLEEEA